jgi:molecular chaperone IbpA
MTNKLENWQRMLQEHQAMDTAAAMTFRNIERWGIGFSPMLQMLRQFAVEPSSSYPPYNITKNSETDYQIVMALAGFEKENLVITRNGNTLSIESVIPESKERSDVDREFIHRGIAMRHFKLNFAIAEDVEITEAELSNGLLVIDLHLAIPDQKKPKVITIK